MTRLLLIESGSRSLLEGILPHLRTAWASGVPIDLVTCYGGLPEGFGPETIVYRVTDYGSPEGRRELIRLLRSREYTVAGMICSGEPIMTKWKWVLAARLRAKVFVLNENCDYFWMHWERRGMMLHFMLFRMGLTGAAAIPTIARLLAFPLMLGYLILYAGFVHIRRKLRTL